MNNELKKKLLDSGYRGFNSYENFELSELIELCGIEFNFVCRNKETGLWGAETHNGLVITKCLSPEEAVANLWLLLNKSDEN